MGESYRGLTIQIGADTSKLSKALKSSNSAISQTNSEIKKLSQALRFDENNTSAVTAKFIALKSQATQTAAKLKTMKAALEQLDAAGIGDVAKDTSNIALAAENAKAKYAQVTAELAKTYKQLEKVAQKNGVAWDKDDIEGSLEALKQVGAVTDDEIAKVQELRQVYSQASNELDVTKQALQYKDLSAEIERTEANLKSLVAEQAQLRPTGLIEVSSAMEKLNASAEEADHTLELLKTEFETLESAAQISPAGMNAVEAAEKNLNQQTTVLKGKLADINTAMDSMNVSKAKVAATSTLDLAKNAQKATDEYKRIATEVAQVEAKLQSAKEQAVKFESEGKKGSEGYKKTQAAVESLEAELQSLEAKAKNAEVEMDTAKAEQQYKELAVQARNVANEIGELAAKNSQLGSSFGGSLSKLKSVGMTMYSSISPAMQQLGNFAIESGDKIDSAFRSMKKTVQGTDQDFQHLKESAIEFSNTNAVSADTILNIEAMGGQLGIAVENLEAFAEVASNLDIATDIDADTIAQDLGQLNGILPDLNDNYEAFGDSLVRLGNNMPAQESAIMDITTRIGSMGGLLGMSTPKILAWASAIAATGQNSESAGTAISNTMSDIESAVSGGGDKLEQFAKIAGMSAEEFAAKWDSDASSALQAFIEGLKRLDESGESVDGTLESLGITGVRQKQALEGLTQTTDTLSDALTMSEDAWNGVSDEWGAAGDAAREAAQKSEGFSGSLQILKNNADNLGLVIAESLVPFIQAASGALVTITQLFDRLPEPIKEGVIAIGGLVAVSGTLVTAWASFGNIIAEYRSRMAASNAVAKLFTTTATKNAACMETQAAAAVTSSSSMQVLGQKTAASTAKMKAATIATKASTAALKTLKVAAGIGAVAAVTALITAVQDCQEYQSNLEKGTKGLSDAIASVNTASAQSASASANAASAYDVESASVSEVMEAHAALADTINDRNSTLATSTGLIDGYNQSIQNLAGQSNLTAEQQSELELAVQGLNETCGTSYTVAKDASGAYQVMGEEGAVAADKIDELVAAQKRQLELDALNETYKDLYSQQAEDAKAYNEQLQKVNQQNELYNSLIEQQAKGQYVDESAITGTWLALENERAKLNELKTASDTTTRGLENLSNQQKLVQMASDESASANVKYAASYANLKAALLEASGSSTSFVSACDALGLSIEDLASTNEDGLLAMAQSWDGNVATMIAKADELGIQIPEEVRAAAAGAQEAGNEVANSVAAGLSNGSVSVDAATKILAAYAQGDYSGAAAAASEAGISIPAALASGIQSGVYSPSDATSYMMSLIALKLAGGDTEAAATALGSDIDAGLAQGIREGTLSEEAASMLGEDVINKAKESLDSHSPSVKFHDLGSDCDAGLAQGIAGNSDAPLSAIGNLASSLIAAAQGALTGNFTAEGSNAASGLASGLSSGAEFVLSSAAGIASSAWNGISGIGSSFLSTASGASSQFASGIGSAASTASSNASAIRAAVISGVANVTNIAKTAIAASSGFARGIGSGKSTTVSNAKTIANAAKGMANVGDLYTSGSHLASNFASGISAGIGWVRQAANSIANAAKAVLHFSVPKEGVWSGAEKGGMRSGLHLAQNWAAGLASGVAEVKSAANELMNGAYAALDKTIDPTIRVNAAVTDIAVQDGVSLAATAAQTTALVGDVAASAVRSSGYQGGSTTNNTSNSQTNISIDGISFNDYAAIVGAARDFLMELQRLEAI